MGCSIVSSPRTSISFIESHALDVGLFCINTHARWRILDGGFTSFRWLVFQFYFIGCCDWLYTSSSREPVYRFTCSKKNRLAFQPPRGSYYSDPRTDNISLESWFVISSIFNLALRSLSHTNVAPDGCSAMG